MLLALFFIEALRCSAIGFGPMRGRHNGDQIQKRQAQQLNEYGFPPDLPVQCETMCVSSPVDFAMRDS